MGERYRTSTASRPPLLLVLAVLALAAPGCGHPPAIHTYEYVTAYDRMSDRYDPLLSLVYVPQADAFDEYDGLIVGEVLVGDEWVESPERAASYATFFRVALTSEMLKLKTFTFISLDKECLKYTGAAPDGVLLVEGMITKFHMGSGLLRYLSCFIPFLELGATDLQIEGRITDARSGRLVAEFADRRRHLCNTPFGPNPRNFRKGYGMKITARETAQCLARFIDMSYYEELPAVQVAASTAEVAASGP